MGNYINVEDCPPTSQVQATIILVSLVVENWKVWFWSSIEWHNIHTKFHEYPFSHSGVIWLQVCITRNDIITCYAPL
jgi:hypothetical protein